MKSKKCKSITIISPVYNEEGSIPTFYERLDKALLTPYKDTYDLQVLFTNNCSEDNTLEAIMDLHEKDERVKVLTLSRNFGYQASVLAGLSHTHTDASIVIDVDCEDPPELLPQFLAEWEEGYDIVYGIRDQREESIVIQWFRKLFYKLLRFSADNDIILNMAEFALLSRRVCKYVIDNQSTFPFIRAEIGYVGFKRKGVSYKRQKRAHGKTHYNFITMTAFAIGGILSSSTYMLRLAAFISTGLLPLNLVFIVLLLLTGSELPFQILVSLDLMYVVLFLAVISIYTARIYKNTVQRPVFIVDWEQSTNLDLESPG